MAIPGANAIARRLRKFIVKDNKLQQLLSVNNLFYAQSLTFAV